MITIEKTSIEVQLNFKQKDFTTIKDAIKAIPGARWNPEKKRWIIPSSRVGELIKIDYRLPFIDDIAPLMELQATVQQRQNETLVQSMATTGEPIEVEGLSPTAKLRPNQWGGVHFLKDHPIALLGDEMGLGKTLQTLIGLQLHQAFPTLIVCPSIVKSVWKEELHKWFPGKTAYICEGRTPPVPAKFSERSADLFASYSTARGKKAHYLMSPEQFFNDSNLPTHDIYVINYEIVAYWAAVHLQLPFRGIVFDEIHRLKEGNKTKQGKAVAQLAYKAIVRYGLSGTTVINRPIEIIAPLRLLGMFESIFHSWVHFITYYAMAKKVTQNFGRGRNARKIEHWTYPTLAEMSLSERETFFTRNNELNFELRKHIYLRREKSEVLTELPPLTSVFLPVDITEVPAYKHLDRECNQTLLNWLDNVTCPQDIIKEAGVRAITVIAKIRQQIGLLKVDNAIHWIQDFMEDNPTQKLIVSGFHQSVQHELLTRLSILYPGKVISLLGGGNTEEREEHIRRFQTDENIRIIVLSLMGGSVGITLTKANYILNVEYAWEYMTHDQLNSRAHRMGVQGNVTAYYLHATGTFDEYMRGIIEIKAAIMAAVNQGDKEELEIRLSKAESLTAQLRAALQNTRLPEWMETTSIPPLQA